MKEQWEQECANLRAELAALQKKLHAVETKQAGANVGVDSFSRWRLSKSMMMILLPVVTLLAAGGVLYGQGAMDALFIDKDGKVGIGETNPREKLHVTGGKIQLDGNQQIKFTDADLTNNLKLQLWSGYGLGINGGTLFYAANGKHSWRDDGGANERMALTTGADGGLTVLGTGTSSFAGSLEVNRALAVTGNVLLSGNLQAPAGVESLRMLRGVVLENGQRFAGDGYAVTKPAVGLYDIVFAQPFPTVPAASATQIFSTLWSHATPANQPLGVGGDTRDNAVITHLSAERIRFKTGDGAGNGSDRRFTFVVIGPRRWRGGADPPALGGPRHLRTVSGQSRGPRRSRSEQRAGTGQGAVPSPNGSTPLPRDEGAAPHIAACRGARPSSRRATT
jgi:hypothetical protein